jgi:hypothetical protein
MKKANYGLVKLSDDCDLVLEIDNNKLQNFMVKLVLKNFKKSRGNSHSIGKMIYHLRLQIRFIEFKIVFTEKMIKLFIGIGSFRQMESKTSY